MVETEKGCDRRTQGLTQHSKQRLALLNHAFKIANFVLAVHFFATYVARPSFVRISSAQMFTPTK